MKIHYKSQSGLDYRDGGSSDWARRVSDHEKEILEAFKGSRFKTVYLVHEHGSGARFDASSMPGLHIWNWSWPSFLNGYQTSGGKSTITLPSGPIRVPGGTGDGRNLRSRSGSSSSKSSSVSIPEEFLKVIDIKPKEEKEEEEESAPTGNFVDLIVDETGQQLAIALGNNQLYFLFDVDHTTWTSGMVSIFQYIIQKFIAKDFFQFEIFGTSVPIKQIIDAGMPATRKTVGLEAKSAQTRLLRNIEHRETQLKKDISSNETNIASYQKAIVKHESNIKRLTEQLEQISDGGSSFRLEKEIELISKMKEVIDVRFHVGTNTLWVLQEKLRMGPFIYPHFAISITLGGRVRFYPVIGNLSVFPGRYLPAGSGSICLGNQGGNIANHVIRGEFAAAISLIMMLLRTMNGSTSADRVARGYHGFNGFVVEGLAEWDKIAKSGETIRYIGVNGDTYVTSKRNELHTINGARVFFSTDPRSIMPNMSSKTMKLPEEIMKEYGLKEP